MHDFNHAQAEHATCRHTHTHTDTKQASIHMYIETVAGGTATVMGEDSTVMENRIYYNYHTSNLPINPILWADHRNAIFLPPASL